MAATRIRWDRLGRWALIAVFAFVLYLYVGPAVNWVSTYRQAGEKRAEVAALKERHAELVERRRQLRDKRALEREMSMDLATALEIVDIFLSTPFEGGRHLARIHQLDA